MTAGGARPDLGALDDHQHNISALRGEGAAKINRLELTSSRFAAQKIATGDQLSRIEDADMGPGHHRPQHARVGLQRGPRHRCPDHPAVAGRFPAMTPQRRASQVSWDGSDELEAIPVSGGRRCVTPTGTVVGTTR